MHNYIQEFKNSLTLEFCEMVIKLYENEPNTKDGVTLGGLNKNIKDTTDYILNVNTEKNENWLNIENILFNELNEKIQLYVKNVNVSYNYEYFKTNDIITDNGFLIQKYNKGKGKYVYHVDSSIDFLQFRSRIIAFIWYLNDVIDGGETEFWGNYKIKPEMGKLIFFPATWTFPHTGLIPNSSDKYIITGWFYEDKRADYLLSTANINITEDTTTKLTT